MSNAHNFGFVYCATGANHFAEALESARRSREVMQEVLLAIFTDA